MNLRQDLRVGNKPGTVMDAKDIVREVQFNPTSMNDIVAGYESGNIQVRLNSTPYHVTHIG